MTRKEKVKTGILVAIPIITAVLSFIDGVVRTLGLLDWQWDKTVYNCVMIIVILIAFVATELLFRDELETGFWKGEKGSSVRGLTVLLINLSACLLIFIKNTETWGYTFGWKHPFSDLWGWPLLWLAAAASLLLVQSPAGKAVRQGLVFLFHKVKEFFSLLGKMLRWGLDLAEKIAVMVKTGDPHALLVFLVFLAVYIAFVLFRVWTMGARTAFADGRLFWEAAAILFAECYLGGGLLFLFPALLSQLKSLISHQSRAATTTKGSTLVGTISQKATLKATFAFLGFVALPMTVLIFSTLQSNNCDFSTCKEPMDYITTFLEFIMAMGDCAEYLLG